MPAEDGEEERKSRKEGALNLLDASKVLARTLAMSVVRRIGTGAVRCVAVVD
jgi:hypothetical protein